MLKCQSTACPNPSLMRSSEFGTLRRCYGQLIATLRLLTILILRGTVCKAYHPAVLARDKTRKIILPRTSHASLWTKFPKNQGPFRNQMCSIQKGNIRLRKRNCYLDVSAPGNGKSVSPVYSPVERKISTAISNGFAIKDSATLSAKDFGRFFFR